MSILIADEGENNDECPRLLAEWDSCAPIHTLRATRKVTDRLAVTQKLAARLAATAAKEEERKQHLAEMV